MKRLFLFLLCAASAQAVPTIQLPMTITKVATDEPSRPV
jgi:hypothetical protein